MQGARDIRANLYNHGSWDRNSFSNLSDASYSAFVSLCLTRGTHPDLDYGFMLNIIIQLGEEHWNPTITTTYA